jgi:hypothetical protein
VGDEVQTGPVDAVLAVSQPALTFAEQRLVLRVAGIQVGQLDVYASAESRPSFFARLLV